MFDDIKAFGIGSVQRAATGSTPPGDNRSIIEHSRARRAARPTLGAAARHRKKTPGEPGGAVLR
ncbi:TPA: hypothetical protein SAO12_000907 [Burkholderia multivorans]|nr:hypothetical protein [Burkholderia multivorans]